jgi:hypothetical protein
VKTIELDLSSLSYTSNETNSSYHQLQPPVTQQETLILLSDSPSKYPASIVIDLNNPSINQSLTTIIQDVSTSSNTMLVNESTSSSDSSISIDDSPSKRHTSSDDKSGFKKVLEDLQVIDFEDSLDENRREEERITEEIDQLRHDLTILTSLASQASKHKQEQKIFLARLETPTRKKIPISSKKKIKQQQQTEQSPSKKQNILYSNASTQHESDDDEINPAWNEPQLVQLILDTSQQVSSSNNILDSLEYESDHCNDSTTIVDLNDSTKIDLSLVMNEHIKSNNSNSVIEQYYNEEDIDIILTKSVGTNTPNRKAYDSSRSRENYHHLQLQHHENIPSPQLPVLQQQTGTYTSPTRQQHTKKKKKNSTRKKYINNNKKNQYNALTPKKMQSKRIEDIANRLRQSDSPTNSPQPPPQHTSYFHPENEYLRTKLAFEDFIRNKKLQQKRQKAEEEHKKDIQQNLGKLIEWQRKSVNLNTSINNSGILLNQYENNKREELMKQKALQKTKQDIASKKAKNAYKKDNNQLNIQKKKLQLNDTQQPKNRVNKTDISDNHNVLNISDDDEKIKLEDMISPRPDNETTEDYETPLGVHRSDSPLSLSSLSSNDDEADDMLLGTNNLGIDISMTNNYYEPEPSPKRVQPTQSTSTTARDETTITYTNLSVTNHESDFDFGIDKDLELSDDDVDGGGKDNFYDDDIAFSPIDDLMEELYVEKNRIQNETNVAKQQETSLQEEPESHNTNNTATSINDNEQKQAEEEQKENETDALDNIDLFGQKIINLFEDSQATENNNATSPKNNDIAESDNSTPTTPTANGKSSRKRVSFATSLEQSSPITANNKTLFNDLKDEAPENPQQSVPATPPTTSTVMTSAVNPSSSSPPQQTKKQPYIDSLTYESCTQTLADGELMQKYPSNGKGKAKKKFVWIVTHTKSLYWTESKRKSKAKSIVIKSVKKGVTLKNPKEEQEVANRSLTIETDKSKSVLFAASTEQVCDDWIKNIDTMLLYQKQESSRLPNNNNINKTS